MDYKTITNTSKQVVLADRAEVADSALKRMQGLLGRDMLKQGQALVITPCSSIHTFFMKFPIDVIFLNKNNIVVSLAESLLPSRLFGSWLKGKLVIELPAGTISRSRTKKGDSISIS